MTFRKSIIALAVVATFGFTAQVNAQSSDQNSVMRIGEVANSVVGRDLGAPVAGAALTARQAAGNAAGGVSSLTNAATGLGSLGGFLSGLGTAGTLLGAATGGQTGNILGAVGSFSNLVANGPQDSWNMNTAINLGNLAIQTYAGVSGNQNAANLARISNLGTGAYNSGALTAIGNSFGGTANTGSMGISDADYNNMTPDQRISYMDEQSRLSSANQTQTDPMSGFPVDSSSGFTSSRTMTADEINAQYANGGGQTDAAYDNMTPDQRVAYMDEQSRLASSNQTQTDPMSGFPVDSSSANGGQTGTNPFGSTATTRGQTGTTQAPTGNAWGGISAAANLLGAATGGKNGNILGVVGSGASILANGPQNGFTASTAVNLGNIAVQAYAATSGNQTLARVANVGTGAYNSGALTSIANQWGFGQSAGNGALGISDAAYDNMTPDQRVAYMDEQSRLASSNQTQTDPMSGFPVDSSSANGGQTGANPFGSTATTRGQTGTTQGQTGTTQGQTGTTQAPTGNAWGGISAAANLLGAATGGQNGNILGVVGSGASIIANGPQNGFTTSTAVNLGNIAAQAYAATSGNQTIARVANVGTGAYNSGALTSIANQWGMGNTPATANTGTAQAGTTTTNTPFGPTAQTAAQAAAAQTAASSTRVSRLSVDQIVANREAAANGLPLPYSPSTTRTVDTGVDYNDPTWFGP